MEVGFFTMPLHPPGSDYTKTLDDDLEQLVILDELGYKEAWIGEHFTSVWENIPAPDLFIAKALAMTKNIVLGYPGLQPSSRRCSSARWSRKSIPVFSSDR